MARMKIKVTNRLQGCSRALADLRSSCAGDELDRLDDVIARLAALTAQASTLMDGGQCAPSQVVHEKRRQPAPQPVPRPIQTKAASAGIDPLDLPARVPERSAFHTGHEDTSIEDPQTADEVRAAMAIPDDQRTEWQQVIVEDFQHLIEFEHAKPPSSLIMECIQAVGRGGHVTPRQEWIAHRFMNDIGWDAEDEAA